MSAITTHVLDTSTGQPAAGLAVTLARRSGAEWAHLGGGITDTSGRIQDLLETHVRPDRGTYRLTFDTGAYFASAGVRSFYPEVRVIFEVTEPTEHYHVPLLLSPYGYSTYRGT